MKINEKVNVNLFPNKQESKSVNSNERPPTLLNVQPQKGVKIP